MVGNTTRRGTRLHQVQTCRDSAQQDTANHCPKLAANSSGEGKNDITNQTFFFVCVCYCCMSSCSFCLQAASMYLVISDMTWGWCNLWSLRCCSICAVNKNSIEVSVDFNKRLFYQGLCVPTNLLCLCLWVAVFGLGSSLGISVRL